MTFFLLCVMKDFLHVKCMDLSLSNIIMALCITSA